MAKTQAQRKTEFNSSTTGFGDRTPDPNTGVIPADDRMIMSKFRPIIQEFNDDTLNINDECGNTDTEHTVRAGSNVTITRTPAQYDQNGNRTARGYITIQSTGGSVAPTDPTISDFAVPTWPPIVNANTDIGGRREIDYHTSNSDSITSANLTLQLDSGAGFNDINITGTLPKAGGPQTITIGELNVPAGGTLRFRLKGTDADGDIFSNVYTVRGRTAVVAQEMAYVGHQSSTDFSSYDTNTATNTIDVRNPGTRFNAHDGNVPDDDYFYILLPEDREVTAFYRNNAYIDPTGGLFTVATNALQIGSINYTAYTWRNTSGYDADISFDVVTE